MHEKIIVLSVNTHGCGVPASWAARHTTVCLDYHKVIIFIIKTFIIAILCKFPDTIVSYLLSVILTLKSAFYLFIFNSKECLLIGFIQKWTCIVSQLSLTRVTFTLTKSLFIWLQEEG